MIALDEIRLALKALRAYADKKSDLPEKELQALRDATADLERRGWQYVGRGKDNESESEGLLAEIKTVFGPLSRGLRLRRGRQPGSIATDKIEKDDLVLADIAAGTPVEKAISNRYPPHAIGAARKRIRRRRKALKEYSGGAE